MSTRSTLLALLAPSLLLAGCGGTINRGIESVHQPVVSRTDYAFDLATSGNGLAGGEEQRLAGWLDSLRVGYGDSVAIDDPSPYAGEARQQIEREVARYGLLLSDQAPITDAPLTPGTMRIVVTRMRASVPNCPDFSRPSEPNFNANTTSDYGCAVNTNLAAMVARPEDLVRGQPGAPSSDPETATKAIQVLREAKPTGAGGLKAESAAGGSGGSQ